MPFEMPLSQSMQLFSSASCVPRIVQSTCPLGGKEAAAVAVMESAMILPVVLGEARIQRVDRLFVVKGQQVFSFLDVAVMAVEWRRMGASRGRGCTRKNNGCGWEILL